MGSISNLLSSQLQSIISPALQGIGLTNNTTGNSLNSIGSSPVAMPTDNHQLSPFAQMMSMLQQLQQSDPSQYQQLTQQVATNLQNAAQTAQGEGNSSAANQLNQLATDFKSASTSGQLPNIQDLAQAIGGGHHHHHRAHRASSDPDGASSNGASGSSGTNQTLSQYLSAMQTSQTQNSSLNPMSIILNTLSSAGLSGS
jgi:hypothetical protein